MNRITLHTLAAATLIVAAGSVAFALDERIDTTRQGPTVTPRCQIAYKYKVKKSQAKGSEKFHCSVGQGYLGNFGASFSGDYEARNHERPTFPFTLFAPVGSAQARNTTLQSKFNSKKLTPEEASLDMGEFGFAMQRLDDDIGGHNNSQFKKAAVSINGTINVTQLKVSGKVRQKRGEWSGSFKYRAKGTVESGENAGKTFSSSIKLKLKKAPIVPPFADR